MNAFLKRLRKGFESLAQRFRAFRERRGKRGLVNEILTIQLVSAALAGSLAVAGVYWGGQWVLKDNYGRWALQWTKELNELASPLYLTNDDDAFVRLDSYVERYPEIQSVFYYSKDGQARFAFGLEADTEVPLSGRQIAAASNVIGTETPYLMNGGVLNPRRFEILAPVWIESLPEEALFAAEPLAAAAVPRVELLGFIGIELDFAVFHDRLLGNMRAAVIVLLLLLATLGFYGRYVLQKALRSISDLEQPIRDLALGDLNVRFKPARHKEMSDIVEALETTVAALGERDSRLRELANHDSLTGVYNRRRFLEVLKREAIKVMRNDHSSALLFIDLDQFKYINDACGHPAGDRLICKVADELRRSIGYSDVVARFGGDEFVVLARHTDQEGAEELAEGILNTMRRMAHVEDGRVFYVHCSIGVTVISGDNLHHDDLIHQADLACREAKLAGRNRMSVFVASEQTDQHRLADVGWMNSLRTAIDEDRFELRFQPINRIDNGETTHHEVLIRLRSETGEIIAPDAFLPSAARFGLMSEIDLWVIRHAALAYEKYSAVDSKLKLSINLSAHAFENDDLTAYVEKTFAEYAVPPERIIFEITESLAIRRPLHVDQQIARLRELGCQFALDDFGTGYSSFSYLQQLKFDYIKIDGTFVRELPKQPVDQKMIRLIAEVGREAGMQTVAEYVQDSNTLALLAELGVDMAQGYFVGRPTELPTVRTTPILLGPRRAKKRVR
ncbi:MAG: EAL domain-containing protein [Pseudomonadota bacterium]